MRVNPSSQLVRPSWIAQLTLRERRRESATKRSSRNAHVNDSNLHAAGKEHDERLERVEVKVERLTDRPAEEDEDGNDEERDLDRRADRDGETQVELVLRGDRDGLQYIPSGQKRIQRIRSASSGPEARLLPEAFKLTVTCSAAFPTTGKRIRLSTSAQ